jgi:hypothetical protein
MSVKRRARLKLLVTSEGGRHFITVPSERVQDLRTHLRSGGVLSGRPEPSCTGFDSIELARGSDTEAVQRLLSGWK